jgi:hypothetical protein
MSKKKVVNTVVTAPDVSIVWEALDRELRYGLTSDVVLSRPVFEFLMNAMQRNVSGTSDAPSS